MNPQAAPQARAETRLFLCLKDNFGVLVHDPASGATAAIDAPEAAPVEAALDRRGLDADRHSCHPPSRRSHGRHCRTQAPSPLPRGGAAPRSGKNSRRRCHGRRRATPSRSAAFGAQVIETPGHTLGQINYFFPAAKLLFAGDTLFSIGCGRVIEGTPELMWQSLLKLRALPDDTRLYCGHEYTEANIRFALTIEPDNAALKPRAPPKRSGRSAAGKPTIPALMGEEKRANVFLRADDPAVAAAVGLAGKPAVEVFAEVRARKNRF